jgi:hypothetical protein
MILEGREKIENPAMRQVMDMAYRIISDQTFDGRLGEADHATEVLRRHHAEVIAAVPADRLLVFDVAEGWDPLCQYLDRPAPDEPFPRVNTTKEFWELIDGATSA